MYSPHHADKFLRQWAAAWFDGCRCLLAYDNIPGYRRLRWTERKRIDHQVAFALLFARKFWCAAFWIGVVLVLTHVLTWRLDLTGAARDLLRATPLLFSLPWVASARRRRILALLHFRETAHRQAGPNA